MSIEQRIMELIAEQVGKDVTVEYVEIEKNNGKIHKGFTIKECGSTLAPTIYFDDRKSEDEIVDSVVSLYSESLKNAPTVNVSDFFTKDYILENVMPVIVNAEKNKKMFDVFVNDTFIDDLAIIYKIEVDMGNGNGFVTLKKDHINYLGITELEIFDSAVKNIQGKGIIRLMNDILGEECPQVPLMVVSNSDGHYGSAVMLDSNIIDKMKAIGEKLYIIPSSVHEFILCPASDDDDAKYLVEMIKFVNANELSPEDFLSDNLFMFDGEEIKKAEVE